MWGWILISFLTQNPIVVPPFQVSSGFCLFSTHDQILPCGCASQAYWCICMHADAWRMHLDTLQQVSCLDLSVCTFFQCMTAPGCFNVPQFCHLSWWALVFLEILLVLGALAGTWWKRLRTHPVINDMFRRYNWIYVIYVYIYVGCLYLQVWDICLYAYV